MDLSGDYDQISSLSLCTQVFELAWNSMQQSNSESILFILIIFLTDNLHFLTDHYPLNIKIRMSY